MKSIRNGKTILVRLVFLLLMQFYLLSCSTVSKFPLGAIDADDLKLRIYKNQKGEPDLKEIQKRYMKTGTFDIGAGFGVASDTREGDNNDARGTIVSLKGYPLGRWYAEPTEEAITKFGLKKDHWYEVRGDVSAGEFSGGGLDSTVHAFGLGFDIIPEMAFILGWGFYDVKDGDVTDTDNGIVFGVSLNIYAFKKIFQVIAEEINK
jgi:hypothetical protein